jgi:hypothetical protein
MKALLIALAILTAANAAQAEEVRARHPASIAKPGSLLNPYVIVNDYGEEVRQLRPTYPVSLAPGDPDYDPGGKNNPLVIDE